MGVYIGDIYMDVLPWLLPVKSVEEEVKTKQETGMSRKLKPDAPENIRDKYNELCRIFKDAQEKGIVY